MPAEKRPLSLHTLPDLDSGVIAAQFDEFIKQVLQDCDERPNDKSARKVSLELQFVPVPSATGQVADEVELSFHIASRIPKAKSRSYHMPLATRHNARGEAIPVAQFRKEDPFENELPFKDPPREVMDDYPANDQNDSPSE